MTSPYSNLADHHFWRRAVSTVEAYAVDPVTSPKFLIDKNDLVATAGSCFAQHISRRLSSIGYNYYVPESGSEYSSAERTRLGYGVFSARYGNIYTVRQLLQLLQEAFDVRKKGVHSWSRGDGRYIDPFRPNGEPDGFDSVDAVVFAREKHIAFVRELFLKSDVFVFTLGLTEGWCHLASGDIFPLAPGVTGGNYDPGVYGFVNFKIGDVTADMTEFLTLLKSVNSKVKVLLTVSPVPLIATFEDRHVLVATSYSKSVLRVAAETAKLDFPWVDYFPSYEIITGQFNMGRYYEPDLREINNAGVSHVMRCFVKNYTRHSQAGLSSPLKQSPLLPQGHADAVVRGLVCDEEMIDKVSF